MPGLAAFDAPLDSAGTELGELLRPLVAAPDLVGISIADFNPALDLDGTHARRVVDELAAVFEAL